MKSINCYLRNSIHSLWFLIFIFILFQAVLLPTIGNASADILQSKVQRTITGNVQDESGNGLQGVSVGIKGSSIGTITDEKGNYSLTVSEDKNTLVFSFIGYDTKEVTIGNSNVVDVILRAKSSSLNEVLVVGYTKQTREKATASISTLDMKELDNVPSVNPVQALQGKMAGVVVPISSGQPGSNPAIRIRGGTSLDGTGSPLVIIDGVYGDQADMRDINPNDIASVQVLKDAASTAAYGARGANGVIVITTKTGSFNQKSVVTFRYQSELETQSRKYDYLSARDYLILGRKTWASGTNIYDPYTKLYVAGNSVTVPTYTKPGEWGKALYFPVYLDNLVAVEGQSYVDNLLQNEGYETVEDPVNYGRTILFKDNHYQDLVWKTAHSQSYDLSIKGGAERTSYYFALGYDNQKGVYIGTDYSRFNAASNVSFKINDWFKLNTKFAYSRNDARDVHSMTNTMTRGTRITPLNRIFDEEGNPLPGEYISVRYQPHELEFQKRKENTEKITMRIEGELTLANGLVWRPSVSLFMNNFDKSYFEKYFSIQSRPRDKSLTRNTERQFMLDQILQYDKTIDGGHHFTLLGGLNYTRVNGLNFLGTGQRSTTDYITTFTGDPATSIINGQVVSNFDISSNWNQTKTISGFGQLNYDYKAKYLFTASLRRDGFSNFAPNNRYATFPGLSAGWNINKESFWNINFINELKLRASYGETGMSSLQITDTYGSYGSYTYDATGGILRTGLANPNLVWETTQTIDGGLDVGFIDSRVNLTVDVYRKITRNRLSSLPLPSESGFGSIKYNVGKMQNEGVEVAISATVLKGSSFSWDANFSFAFNRSMILELPDNGRDKNRIDGGTIYSEKLGKDIEVGGYAEGERPGGMWAFESNGIFATDADAAASPIQDLMVSAAALGKPKHAGDVNWADLNGDGIIDSKDVIFMGYRMPDKIGGMQNTFRYKSFSLRFTMDYAMGHVINNGALARSMGNARAGNEGAVTFAKDPSVWHYPGQTDAKYPRYGFNDTDFGYANHLRHVKNGVGVGNGYSSDVDFYFKKGDFLAFREISLTYELPKEIAQKIKSSGIRLNAGVYNLGYLTAYDGLNPEEYNGYDPGDYPRPRQFTLGATINF